VFKKLGIALLALLATTTPALAGPVVIVGALLGGAVGAGAAAVGLIGGSIFAAAAIGAVVGAAAGALLGDGLLGGFDVPSFDGNNLASAAAENTGILVDKQGTLEHIPIVYGQRMVSGTRVFVDTNGTDNRYLYIALVLCEGEIQSIDEVFIDDVLSTDKMYKGRVKIQKFTGTDSQAASSLLSQSPNWGSKHQLKGLAYLAIRLEWKKIESNEDARQNPFSGIPRIKAIVRGRKVADATSAGSVAYGSETVRYSTNPADHILDYLRNDRYGKGLANDRIDFTSFSTASSKFDATVTYHKTGVTGKMMTSNAVIDTKKKIFDNVKTFLTNMRCGMPYVQGKFKLKLLDTGNGTNAQSTSVTPVVAITDNELVGNINVQGPSTRDQFNQVVVSHPSPGNNYEMTEITYPIPDSQQDIDLLAEDDNKRLTKTISLQHITEAALAADLAHIILYRSRGKKTITFKSTSELHELEVGDVVTITYAPLGFSAAQYRIQSMKIEPDYTISFQAVEHAPSEYVFKQAHFASIPPKTVPLVFNSTPTNNFLINQATTNSTYVPAPITQPTTPGNGVINTGRSAPTGLTAGSYALDNNSEYFNIQWTRPSDYFQYHSIVMYVRKDYIGETTFNIIKQTLDIDTTSFREAFNTGPRQYTIRVQYRTLNGQLSNPNDVQITTAKPYSTSSYTAGVKIYAGSITTL